MLPWISRNQLWWTIAFGAVPLFFPHKISLSTNLIFIGILAVPWAVRYFRKDAYRHNPTFDFLLFLFLFTHLPGFYASIDIPLSTEKFTQNLIGVGLASGLLSKERSLIDLKRLLFLVIVGCALLALLVPFVTKWEWSGKLLQIPGLAQLSSFRYRLSEDVNANIFGGLMTLMLPVAFGFRLTGAGDLFPQYRYTPRILDFSLIIIAMMFVLSQARGGILGFGIALLFMVFFLGKKFRWCIAGFLYVVLAGIVWLGPSSIINLLGGSGIVAGWDVRFELWSRALYMIQDFPFSGVGIGLYGRVANILYPFFLISPDEIMGHAHQLLLQIAVDLGIPGLTVYCAILGCVISAVPLSKAFAVNSTRFLNLGLLGGLLAMLVHGLLDCPLWSSKLAPTPWIIMAFLLALTEKKGQTALKRWEIFTWWLLISLLAIAQMGDRPLFALVIASLGASILGVSAQVSRFSLQS